jgi:hypothetical protein
MALVVGWANGRPCERVVARQRERASCGCLYTMTARSGSCLSDTPSVTELLHFWDGMTPRRPLNKTFSPTVCFATPFDAQSIPTYPRRCILRNPHRPCATLVCGQQVGAPVRRLLHNKHATICALQATALTKASSASMPYPFHNNMTLSNHTTVCWID